MKILHTADWHIGKKLHRHELSRDFDLFVEWLCNLLEKEQVDLLLISGDVFDLANPSSDARKQYYQALIRMRKFPCRIIITGGNHDSPAMLEAPKEILRELDIHIIGGVPEHMEDLVIPVSKDGMEPEIVIAALPYLRDSDLRKATDGVTYQDRLEATRKGIQSKFREAEDICRTKYPGVPALAMGHLFAAGIESSESERDIQIGNQAAFQAAHFGTYFQYVALGHIHKPQKVSASVPTFYSGSPLPLSFSERRDEKRVLLLDTKRDWEPQSVPVPKFRNLLKVSGNLEQLQEKLDHLPKSPELEGLLEVELIEAQYDAVKLFELDELVSAFDHPGYRIVKHRARFSSSMKTASETHGSEVQLQDLKPREVFNELIENHEMDPDTKQEVLSAFDELLESLNHESTPMTTHS